MDNTLLDLLHSSYPTMYVFLFVFRKEKLTAKDKRKKKKSRVVTVGK